ncbi:BglII/BstYI family type II restriction endonuclease [Acidimangrovimonas pyrenivorans]|uniref:BglII/BstYI family type II restriction endonuclease n=1 Tax=Acidimangrovimonas pyrenivorans TaxID=2030798 RepID=A0ABV7AK14_9RHOB
MLEALREAGYDVQTRNHAEAILRHDFPDELEALTGVLAGFRISMAELIGGGGGESGQTQRLRRALAGAGWTKHNFAVQTIVDGTVREAISHEIDHIRRGAAGTLALEIEWNNKDPFFDRDLENFQRLHAQSAISLGIIVTRGRSMQDELLGRITGWLAANDLHSEEDLARLGIGDRTARQAAAVAGLVARGIPFHEAFARHFVSDKFGPSSTHWAKLEDRVLRGVGNPCPLLLLGLPATILSDAPPAEAPPEDPMLPL